MQLKNRNEHKEAVKLLTELSFDAIFLSKDGVCAGQNVAAQKLFGYADEEVIGKDEINCIHPIDREVLSEKMQHDFVPPVEASAIKKDGTSFSCEVQAKYIMFRDRKYRIISIRDISAQKKVENELSERIKELEVINSSIPNVVWRAKIDEQGNVSDTYISGSVNQLLGLPHDSIKHDWDKFMSFVDPAHLPALKAKLAEGFRRPGEVLGLQYKIKKHDGQTAWLASSGRLYSNEGNAYAYGFTIDITKQKYQEEKLRQLNATKDKFFSIISHDLKNPFTAFMGFSELMIRQIGQGRYEHIEKYARAILQTARQGSELLSNLLDWSKSQRKQIVFRPEQINVTELLKRIIAFYADSASSKELEINLKLSSEVDLVADQNMLETILRNLISNAIKFSYRQKEIEIFVEKAKNETVFKVKDHGVGLTHAAIEKLFQLAVHPTTHGTEKERGTGLGLLLCKDFVDEHGGEIGVESKPGKGSVFWFTIPDRQAVS